MALPRVVPYYSSHPDAQGGYRLHRRRHPISISEDGLSQLLLLLLLLHMNPMAIILEYLVSLFCGEYEIRGVVYCMYAQCLLV